MTWLPANGWSVVNTLEPGDKSAIFFFKELLILPPHKLNRWEDLVYHHTDLTAGRMLPLEIFFHNTNTY